MVRNYNNLYLCISMTCQQPKRTVDVGVQTVIRVYPYILDHQQQSARVSSDKKMQTEITVKPDVKNEKFYSLLRFTPYQDIQKDSIRIINLPRLVRLHFWPGVESDKMAQAAKQFSLADDDGVGYICSEIIHRLENRSRRYLCDASVQTDLKVHPHLLKDEHVATVITNSKIQTDDSEDQRYTTDEGS